MASVQVTYDQMTVFLACQNERFPLFDIMLPTQSRSKRCDAVLRILPWIKELRQWFDTPGLISVRLSEFFDRVSLHILMDVRLCHFQTLLEMTMDKTQCQTYDLAIGTDWENQILPRDLTTEEFVTRLILVLMA